MCVRGKKYPDDVREQAFAMYAVCGSYAETAKKLGVAESTVKTWVKNKKPDGFDELRRKNKRSFVERAGAIIDKGMDLLDRRISTALDFENELAELLSELSTDDEIPPAQKKAIAQKLSALQIQSIRDLTTAIGTLYDKRALAQGESTENTVVEIRLPEGADDYAG